jgi:hypothetical protein
LLSRSSGRTEVDLKVRLFAGLAICALVACSPSKLAYGQVKSAMMDAGLSGPNAACMAERMTDRLSLGQLQKLKQLRGEKRSLFDYVAAVRRVGDSEAIEVTATSAALCATGLARERR